MSGGSKHIFRKIGPNIKYINPLKWWHQLSTQLYSREQIPITQQDMLKLKIYMTPMSVCFEYLFEYHLYMFLMHVHKKGGSLLYLICF